MLRRLNPVHVLLGLTLSAATLAVVGHHAGGKVLAVFCFAGLFTVGFAASALVTSALWPAQIERSRAALASMPLRCLLVGGLVVAAQVWIVLNSHPLAGPAALACVLIDIIWLAQGLPALATLVGERLGADTRPQAVATGSLLFAATGTLPVIGWLLSTTMLLQALGAALVPVQARP